MTKNYFDELTPGLSQNVFSENVDKLQTMQCQITERVGMAVHPDKPVGTHVNESWRLWAPVVLALIDRIEALEAKLNGPTKAEEADIT